LISGVFSVVLMSPSSAMEGVDYSGVAKWRPTTPTGYAGFSGNGDGSQYRFRPMDREQRRVAPLKWTYRPSQLKVPKHYVYRPLQVKRNRNSVDHWYDGQADGEGAWYTLTGQGEWPRVSQYINSQPYP
jgi:hypothetical protein